MFYSIYLFSSLILICNNFVSSNENVQKVTWACATQDCNTPISDFVTKSYLKVIDHVDKLKYNLGSKGQVLKKPVDNSEFWYAQINGEKGYVNKKSIREEKIFYKDLPHKVEEDYPFRTGNFPNGPDVKKISPSQPTVVDGTTLYNDLDESDSNKVLLPVNSTESTPILSPAELSNLTSDSQNSIPSTPGDSVDLNSTKPSISNEEIAELNSEVTPGPSDNSIETPVNNVDSPSKSINDNKNVGYGSWTPVDEEVEVEIKAEEDNDDDDDEVPSKSESTNERGQSETEDEPNKKNEQNPSKEQETKSVDSESASKDVEPTLPSSDTLTKTLPESITETPEIIKPEVSTEQIEISTEAPNKVEDSSNDLSGEITTTQKPTQFQNLSDNELSSSSSIPDGKADNDLNANLSPEQSTPSNIDVTMDITVKKESDANAEAVMGTDEPSKIIHHHPYNQYGSPYVYNKNQQQGSSPSYDTHPPAPSYLNDFSTTPSPDDSVFSEGPSTIKQETPEVVTDAPVVDTNVDVSSEVVTNTPEVSVKEEAVTEVPELSSTEEISKDNLNDSSENEEDSSTESSQRIQENVETTLVSSDDTTSSPSENIVYQTDTKSEQPNVEDLSNPDVFFQETQSQDSPGFYSSFSSFFSSLTELFQKSKLPEDDTSIKDQPDDKIDSESPGPTAPPGHCSNGISCKGLEPPIGGEDQDMAWNSYSSVGIFKSSVPLTFNSILYICITSVVILLFSLGYYYIDKSQNSSSLVAKVNQLSQELFVTKKERDTLEDQLLKIKESCNMMDSSKIKQDSKLSSLQNALEKSESSRTQLEETVIRLEKEVETLMDQGMEMHKLLSETISDEERSQMLLANIDELKESLSMKLDEIVVLTNQLDKRNEEVLLAQIDVRNANDRIADLERKLESCKASTEDTFSKKLQDQQKQKTKLQKLLEEKGVSIAKLESELAKTKAERDSAEARASSAEGGLQAAHGVGTGEAREMWLDATSARASLATAEKQNDALQQSIKEINANNKLLQDKISSLSEELATLNLEYESVEKDKVNALTKLQVLSDYFKEKETKLQEELGVKESQWLQKESEDHTIYEQIKSLREEIASYKAQNEKLRTEILDQESSYKVQIANEEQKTYDNWVALRQAERKVKELQMESAHYRNRLTQLETANNQSTTEALNPNGLDKNSFSAPSPPFMMLPPPPPAEFFSLPPTIHPTASRPPPLGRISSPQLSGEMIPPPPLVQFDMYVPSSTTPPPPIMYKPQPRDRPPPPKDSPPSNYSSESVNDKPPRRRRR